MIMVSGGRRCSWAEKGATAGGVRRRRKGRRRRLSDMIGFLFSNDGEGEVGKMVLAGGEAAMKVDVMEELWWFSRQKRIERTYER
ncbi:hypothetical protein HanIR_Chr17g0862481 [Helianthus annuus]|nr:hypothetical protein HanIR_Chr17g0862481 [Helianthus annuus]